MEQPLVSIVMPVYNVEKYIETALESAVNQTYPNIEILVVDDGTKDHSIDVIQKTLDSDKRIRVIHRVNGGLSAARNTGLQDAKGKYVLFFDSDDTISCNLVEAAVVCAEAQNADVVVFGYEIVHCDTQGKTTPVRKTEFSDSNLRETATAQTIPDYFTSAVGFAWNKLYRVNYLKDNGLIFEEGLSMIEDVVFNHEAFLKTERISFISGTFYQYYTRERTTLSNQYYDNYLSMFERSFVCRTDIIRNVYPNAKNHDELVAYHYVNGIRSFYAMLLKHGNQEQQRVGMAQVKIFLGKPVTKEYIKGYKPNGLKDKVVKLCLQNNLASLLLTIYKVWSHN